MRKALQLKIKSNLVPQKRIISVHKSLIRTFPRFAPAGLKGQVLLFWKKTLMFYLIRN